MARFFAVRREVALWRVAIEPPPSLTRNASAMLLYFAFVATLNLCVGYALGAHFGGAARESVSDDENRRRVNL